MDLPTIRVRRCRLITEKALREWLKRKAEAKEFRHRGRTFLSRSVARLER
jgi:hypothetical protein